MRVLWSIKDRGTSALPYSGEVVGKPFLERSIVAAGQYDHPLTSTALRDLGHEPAGEASPHTTAGLIDAILRDGQSGD